MSERECSSAGCSKESCDGCPSKQKPQSFLEEANRFSRIRHVVGVVSGKGGVGKSMVTASLANRMTSLGYKAGKTFVARLAPENQSRIGEKVKLYLDPEKIHIFDKETEESVFY